jgi:hypothetical protein
MHQVCGIRKPGPAHFYEYIHCTLSVPTHQRLGYFPLRIERKRLGQLQRKLLLLVLLNRILVPVPSTVSAPCAPCKRQLITEYQGIKRIHARGYRSVGIALVEVLVRRNDIDGARS